MSARPKKSSPKKASHPSYKMMALAAIAASSHFGHGTTRQAIAKYIKTNFGCDGAHFNAALRKALADGVAAGVFVHGDSAQRFKMTDAGRALRNPPKAKKSKKKSASAKKKALAKKKAASKKKKKTSKKKKVSKKKKPASKKKKKTASKKRKPASKKKSSSKKKKAARRSRR